VWGAHAVIERVLAPLLIGCDPHDVAEIDRRMDRACKHNWFAKAALEMACWDIQGKATGRPVFALLGGPRRPLAVRGRASMGALDPASARRWTADRVAAGFTAFKIKVGGKPAEDEKRVRVVRDAIGPDCALVIDATGGWGAEEAIACITALADCDLAFVEQPTRAGDYGALARVRAKTGCRVIADDGCFDLVHAHELARQRCCDALSVYPGKNGGLRKAKEIVEFAAGEGLPCTIGSNLEWDVATAAMGHLVVACDNLRVETIPGDMEGPAHYTVPTSTRGAGRRRRDDGAR
jgi:muconate cycloisomerase